MMVRHVLTSPDEVVRALLTYTDWWQPATGSILQANVRGRGHSDGIRGGLVEHLDERDELCRRMEQLGERERRVLYLWYVKLATPRQIAREVGVSERSTFRIRARAVHMIVDLGEPEAA